MQKETWIIYLPIFGLIVLVLVLYFPQMTGYSGHISVLSDLTFMDKTTLLLTFALAAFAAVEGFSTFKRASTEAKRHQIEDARNELEKAYGPLYTLLNKTTKAEDSAFWLDFEERRRINEIIATYPFMFPLQIIDALAAKEFETLHQRLRIPILNLQNMKLTWKFIWNLETKSMKSILEELETIETF